MATRNFGRCISSISVIIFLAGSSLAQESNFAETQIGHVYHVSIPSYMTKTYNLNEVASLQYLNAAKETYVIVIEDSKEELMQSGTLFDNPQEFYEFFQRQFTDNSCEIGLIQSLDINGKPAVQVEITKPFETFNIAYLVTIVETETHFYKMLAWTLSEYKDLYFPDFKLIAGSLRE